MLAAVPDTLDGVAAVGRRFHHTRHRRGHASAALDAPAAAPQSADLAVSGGLRRPGAASGRDRESGGSTARETFTDKLPAQLAFVSSPDGCSADDGTVSCGPVAVLEPGTSRTWRFTVRLDSGYTGNGSDIRNTATATAQTKDPKPENNTSSAAGLPGSTVNKPTAELAVTKETVGTKPPVPGETFDYRIRVTNNGPSADAFNVKLTDNLPEGLSYVASSPAGCTVAGHLVSCRRAGALKVGETVEYLLTVKVDPAYGGDGRQHRPRERERQEHRGRARRSRHGSRGGPRHHQEARRTDHRHRHAADRAELRIGRRRLYLRADRHLRPAAASGAGCLDDLVIKVKLDPGTPATAPTSATPPPSTP
ncbi:hypothetical protein ACFWBF_33195 [Streptomyces sp. NPDC060028]|uniref:hypothetical protein n=1 Tax=Streptomyces sp. NPDC060028 TaxID=3347041 RepID=UPI0036A805BC